MDAGPSFDVAIVGLGAMGSAAALELARRGHGVIGFDRFCPPHERGSSHGDSRIIREAYFEDPVYVPMVQRALELWRALQDQAGVTLLTTTGGLMLGRPDGELVRGTLDSARIHRLAHDVLPAAEARRRFPALAVPDGMVGVWEPRAGVLAAEACVAAQLTQARALGAALHMNEPVERWQVDGGGVEVVTARASWRARRMIVSAGAWTAKLLPDPPPLRVERQVLHWFDPAGAGDMFDPGHCPVHLWQIDGGRYFYGFPDMGAGVKLAFHHGGRHGDPDALPRDVAAHEVDEVRAALRRFVPAADGRHRVSRTCLYTNTPDEHFLIDRLPGQPAVIVASPCSGHGFKFAPVIGEIVADLAEGRAPQFDLAPFRWRWR